MRNSAHRKGFVIQKRSFNKFSPLAALALSGIVAAAGYAQAPATGAAATPAQTETAPAAPSLPDKVVLKVGDEKITQADFDFLISTLNTQGRQSLATQGRRALGDQFALMMMLEQQALSEHLDSSPDFLRHLAFQKRQLLAQAAYEELVKKAAVSAEETHQYYTSHPAEFDELQIRQVIVRKRPEGAKQGDPGLAPEEAKARAETIRKALTSGTDVKKIVQDFQVPNVVLIDEEPRTVRQDGLRPEMAKAAAQLKDGELSENFDLPQAVVFFQMLGHRRADVKDVTSEIENTLRQEKVESGIAELKKKSTVWMDEQYFAPAKEAPRAGESGETPQAPSPQ
jgi:parvulin-like peptidyl-prolyl isomerase